jgi:NAD(P)-dependent dehydrogenase (short-subunit alcohol dehydrogenase family)
LIPIILDVTSDAQIAIAAARVRDGVGDAGLQGLVNNAGIGVGGPLEYLPIAELRRQLEVNVVGLVAVTQAFLPLIRAGKGRIVNVGSIAGRLAMPMAGPYAASKFAVEAISDAWRAELRPWGIPIALLEPGAVATPIWDKTRAFSARLSASLPEECLQLYAHAIGKVEEMVELSERIGAPPGHVARKVSSALTARRPKTRYLVARGARIQALMAAYVPDRVRDWFFDRMLRR